MASNSNPIYNLKRSKLFENSENSNLQDDLELGEEFGNFTAKSRKMGPKRGVSKRCTKPGRRNIYVKWVDSSKMYGKE